MVKRGKNNRAQRGERRDAATPEKRLASPPKSVQRTDLKVLPNLVIQAWIQTSGMQPKTQHIEIQLPCTLADLAYQLSEWSFAAVEELAFAAGIEFIPPVPIKKCGEPETEGSAENPNCFCPDCGADLGFFYNNRIRMVRDADIPF